MDCGFLGKDGRKFVTAALLCVFSCLSCSERCGGAAGFLADEAAPRRRPEERRPRHLRVRPRLHAALHLLRHAPRGIVFREVS